MNTVTLEDALHYTSVSDVYASPKGGTILYKTHRPILSSNSYEDKAWMVSPKGTKEVPYYNGKVIFEGEDTYLYAVKKNPHQTDIFWQKKDEGAQKLAGVPYDASILARTKDGGLLLLVSTDIEEKRFAEGKSEEEREAIYEQFRIRDEDCMIADEFPYWYNGEGIINKKRTILFYLEGESAGLIQLTGDTFHVAYAAYDPASDGVWISGDFFEVYRPRRNGLYYLTLKDKILKEELSSARADVMQMGVLGEKLIFASSFVIVNTDEGSGSSERMTNLYSFDHEKVERLTDLEISFGSSVFSDIVNGGGTTFQIFEDKIYFIATWHERASVWSLDKEGELKEETKGASVVHSFCAITGGIIWCGLVGLGHQEMYLESWDKKRRALTDYNGAYFRDKELSLPIALSFDDTYGNTIIGWVLKPSGWEEGKTYPAILDIHGGPRGAYGPVYFHEMQYWASCGYYVMFANPSGGTGRGASFGKIRGGTGGSDYEDLMGFVDLVLESYPDIDPKRLGVTGGSYGGFLTNWIIGHTNRFAAAVSQRSTANNFTEACDKDIAPGFVRSYTDPRAKDRFEKLWETSPIRFIDENTATPTLFLHSLNDYRCYHVESLQMYAVLSYFNVPTRMVLFKGEHHGLSREGHPRNRLRRLEEITKWMDFYLKNESAPTADCGQTEEI